jgi:hypothetical protein
MSKEKDMFLYFEDDSHSDLEDYMKMSPEDLERSIEILYRDMKNNPQKKEPVNSKVKFFI